MGLSFTSVDFETANAQRSSVCAVGVAKVVDGVVVEQFSRLVNPGRGVEFNPMNVSVHGIRPHEVAGAPTWDALWPWFADLVADDVLVAHNAPFDRSVLRRAGELYGLDWVERDFACTWALAKRALALPSYKLPHVVGALGLASFRHHDAEDDAVAAARVAVSLAERGGHTDARDLVTHPC